MIDKIKIDELDIDTEYRKDDEDFNETYQKFCILVIDNDNQTAEKIKNQILENQENSERYQQMRDIFKEDSPLELAILQKTLINFRKYSRCGICGGLLTHESMINSHAELHDSANKWDSLKDSRSEFYQEVLQRMRNGRDALLQQIKDSEKEIFDLKDKLQISILKEANLKSIIEKIRNCALRCNYEDVHEIISEFDKTGALS